MALVEELENLNENVYHKARQNTIQDLKPNEEIVKEFRYQVCPAPKMSNHPHMGLKNKRIPDIGEHTLEILMEFQIEQEIIDKIIKETKAKL